MSIKLILIFLLISRGASGEEFDFWRLLEEQEFKRLAEQFVDNSWINLFDLLQNSKLVKVTQFGPTQGMLFLKKEDRIQAFELRMEYLSGKCGDLQLIQLGQEFQFIDSFKRINLQNFRLNSGDLEIFFEDATLYFAFPFRRLVFLSGKWRFLSSPSDDEERLTLKYVLRKDEFSLRNALAVFFLNQEQLEVLLSANQSTESELPAQFKYLKNFIDANFGLSVDQKITIYFPVPEELFVAYLLITENSLFFRYVDNPSASPRITLYDLNRNRLLLSYNPREESGKKRLILGPIENSGLQETRLKLFLNPEDGFLQAEALLQFNDRQYFRYLKLNPELSVEQVGVDQLQCSVFQNGKDLLVAGPALAQLKMKYRGYLKRIPAVSAYDRRYLDNFMLLFAEEQLFPQGAEKFMRIELEAEVPQKYNLLAPGRKLLERRDAQKRKVHFLAPASRHLALAVGDFEPVRSFVLRPETKINFWGAKKVSFKVNFSQTEIIRAFQFLADLFGPLDLAEINVLLIRSEQLGGLSYPGLIFFNFADFTSSYFRSLKTDIFAQNPVVFVDINRDNFIHELAHQWWGGVIGPKSEYDTWINEGMAQLGNLLFLEKQLSPSRFESLINQVKRSVRRAEEIGPLSYGRRLMNIGATYRDYQSIIYNKSALLFLMTREIMGKETFEKKLRLFLRQYGFQLVSTADFINFFSSDSPLIRRLLSDWVYQRRSPRVSYSYRLENQKLVLIVRQFSATSFVIPLKVRLKEGNQYRTENFLLTEREQEFSISSNEKLEAFWLETRFAPCELDLERR